jgi:Uma2 family endonuclease
VDFELLLGPEMTLDEWSELPEDVPGEIVDGRLVEEEMPDYIHEVIVAFLARVLGVWSDTSGAMVATSEVRFAIDPTRGRKPDLTVFFAGRRPPRRGLVSVPPDLAIEVLSLGARNQRRDRVDKLSEYAAFNVHWYWIVDPEERTFEIYEIGDDGTYALRSRLATGVVVGVPGLPGLELDLDVLWAKVDELGD